MITPRPLVVVANDETRLVGAPNPPLTYEVGSQGLLGGDTLSGALTTTATPASPAGAYTISQRTLAATTNYVLTYIPGVLDVEPLTVPPPAPPPFTPTQDLASTIDRLLTGVFGHPVGAAPFVLAPIDGAGSTAAQILLDLADPRFDKIVVCTGGAGASANCVVIPRGQQRTSALETRARPQTGRPEGDFALLERARALRRRLRSEKAWPSFVR